MFTKKDPVENVEMHPVESTIAKFKMRFLRLTLGFVLMMCFGCDLMFAISFLKDWHGGKMVGWYETSVCVLKPHFVVAIQFSMTAFLLFGMKKLFL